ncbi:MAG: hypothetical protein J7497_13035 [Chitinophagaceae bacterium]|nr:hypothetical protein [Chitinophagaceae bacterium]
MLLRSLCLAGFLSCSVIGFGQAKDSVPYYIVVEDETLVHRSFMFYDGKVLPYCISVGSPEKTHYSINSFNAALIKGWRGQFLNANLMWVHKARGIGVAQPVGDEKQFGNEKAYASENNYKNNWGDSISVEDNCQFLGYDVDKQNRPLFRYKFNGSTIEDNIAVVEGNINRTINIVSPTSQDTYFRLISGEEIKKISSTEYLIDNLIHIIIPKKNNVFIQQNGKRKLLLTKLSADFNYTISWK